MKTTQTSASKKVRSQIPSRYIEVLGETGAAKIRAIFERINQSEYKKSEVHTFEVRNLKHPVHLRTIRADMQSFVNTFVDPYFENKPFLQNVSAVIDAGANIGYTAAMFANWWPEARIVGIEPDKENYELALKNTAGYKNVYMVHGALWHKEGDLQIKAGQEDGFVVREIGPQKKKVRAENLTKGFSIPQLRARYKLGQIDLIKCNIEGSEKEIFSAEKKDWLADTTAMLIELHDGKNPGCSHAVFSAIKPYSFAVAETAPYGILFVKENVYRKWYSEWYRENIYKPNIDKKRFPDLYLDEQ
jgi:FkbM family methyltransferase